MFAGGLQMTFRLQPLIHRLRRSAFVRNVLLIMSGTAIAQLIGFALSPVISRLFSPADFGVFGSFNAVASIIATGVTLEYSQALMLPKEKGDAANLFCVSCLSTSIIAFCCLLACLAAPSLVQNLIKAPNAWCLLLLVLAILVSGLSQACQAWCVRVKAFKQISVSQIVRSISANGTQLGLGWTTGGALALIFGSILGDALASVQLVRTALLDLWTHRRCIRGDRMRWLAKEYRDFPLYAATQNVVSGLSIGLPVLLLTHFYGIVVAGAYAFGMRILYAPIALVQRGLRPVLFQKASEIQHRGGSLVPLYVKITLGLFALALVPSLVLLLWAPCIFTFIFGSQWNTAGDFGRSLVVWLMVHFCSVAAALFARLIRIQRTMFLCDLVMLGGRATALVLGGLYLNPLQTVTLFSFVGAAMNALYVLLVGHTVIRKERQVSIARL